MQPTGKELTWRVVLLAGAPLVTVLLVAVAEATGLAPDGATLRVARLLGVALLGVDPTAVVKSAL